MSANLRHDDLCPCTRYRAQAEFCTCNAVAYDQAVKETAEEFGRRLRDICKTPTTNTSGTPNGEQQHG